MSKNNPGPTGLNSAAGGTDLPEMLSRRGGRSMSTIVILGVVLIALGFLGGVFTGQHFGQPAAAAGGGNGPGGQGGFPGGFPGGNGTPPGGTGSGGFQFGTITSIDGNTITMRTQSGETVKVQVGSSTDIQVTKSGSMGDLSQGDTIVVVGSGSSGTIKAQRISEGGGIGGGGFPGPGSSPTP